MFTFISSNNLSRGTDILCGLGSRRCDATVSCCGPENSSQRKIAGRRVLKFLTRLKVDHRLPITVSAVAV